MKILAIDPATKCGWALSQSVYGVWDLRILKDETWGMLLIRLRSKLNELYNLEKFDVIAYERPGGLHTISIITQSKIIGIIEEFCELNKIDYKGFSSKEIKKFATGKGNAGKPLMIIAAKEKYNYLGNNDNEADALHLLELANSQLNG